MHQVIGVHFPSIQLVAALVSVLLTIEPSQGDQWSQFRGVKLDGVAQTPFPESWGQAENVRWKVPIQGEGWSCPIVWDDRVFVTAAVPLSGSRASSSQYREGRRGEGADLSKLTYRWETICIDAKSGQIRWRKTAREGSPRLQRHQENSYASETPTTDGQRVYVYFGMMGLYCYDMDGNLQWERDLGNYEMRAGWGTASSPVVFDGKLFLQIDNEEQSFVVALNAETGDEIWRANRDEMSQYSTPIIWQNSLRTELVTCARVCRSYDPNTGKLLWELGMEGGRSSATPLAIGDRLFVGTELRNRGGPDDGGGYLFALQPSESGIAVAWKTPEAGIQMASPVLCAEHVYLLERRSGTLHCVSAKTGERAYRQRIPGARAFWASPWTRGDKVFCLDDNGTTHVLGGGPKFQVLDKNEINERSWSTPAVANGALFLRTSEHIYCFASNNVN